MSRVTVLSALVAVYVLVSVVAYTDYPRDAPDAPLSEQARKGQALWRRNNCQACHQIYGFGGFLGPDLTNRIDDSTQDEEFLNLLSNGKPPMPAFHLEVDEQAAILEYLRSVGRTGNSQPPPLAAQRTVPRARHVELLIEEWKAGGRAVPAAAQEGGDAWTQFSCGSCHVPFTVGVVLAPDLSASAVDRAAESIAKLLKEGRGRMPTYPVSHEIPGELGSLLEWMNGARAELIEVNDRMLEREEFEWSSLPWFEYR